MIVSPELDGRKPEAVGTHGNVYQNLALGAVVLLSTRCGAVYGTVADSISTGEKFANWSRTRAPI